MTAPTPVKPQSFTRSTLPDPRPYTDFLVVIVEDNGTRGLWISDGASWNAFNALGADLETTIQSVIDANAQLGLLAAPVSSIVDGKIADYNTVVPTKINTAVTAATTGNVAGKPYSDVQTAVNLLIGLIGTTSSTPVGAPVANAAPYIVFGNGATVTMTNASPAVVSWTAHGKVAGSPVQFTTTGVLPAGTPGQVYYVIATGLTANAFQFSATLGGAAVNATGAGSGVHTGYGQAVGGGSGRIVGGTYTVATPSSVTWNTAEDGTLLGNQSATGLVVPGVTGAGHVLSVTEFYVFNGQQYPGKQSASYLIAAPAVSVPVAQTKPGPMAIANNIVSAGSNGTYSPPADAYTYRYLNPSNTVLGTAATIDATNLKGVTLTFEVTPYLSGNPGLPNTSLPFLVPGAVAPSYTGGNAIEPGWNVPVGGFAFGTRMTMDLQLDTANGNAQTADVQLYRAGALMTNAGASATGVTSYFYDPISIDVGLEISALVTPRNALVGTPVTVAPVLIGPQVSGAPATIGFVGKSNNGSSSASATMTIAAPSSSQAGDECTMVATINDYALTLTLINGVTPATEGWAVRGTAVANSTPEGQYAICLTKILTGSEVWPMTLTFSGNGYKSAAISAYRGATRVVDSGSTGSAASNPSPVSPVPNSVTPDAVNQKLVTLLVYDILNGTAGPVSYNSLAAGINTRVNVGWGGADYAVLSILDQDLATASATTGGPYAATTDSTATGWAAFNVLLGL